ncbi:uncharacterized protein BYT42DRAFT_541703 [Radiomyces spectabilis]|uniref:uncharacterized protein n=1 Tax=Radiomyces spectabilis TaxID=64574 RepID=UPI002220D62F|nr:uncharacterized protein BYT42DRAFT_541703 [Radiomyces spectabilis]KAI8393434.1 hypothetical protein BYT42DRAFT_541703 [Radiomyces spectabilis]
MPPISGTIPLLSSILKPALGKTLAPVAAAISQQPTFPAHQPYHTHRSQPTVKTNDEVITENVILNSFPRPNLKPTLDFAKLSSNSFGNVTCGNCCGPHSTQFCPC